MCIRRHLRILVGFLAVVALASFAGCPGLDWPPGTTSDPNSTTARLSGFNSADELLAFFKARVTARSRPRLTLLRDAFALGGALPTAANAEGGADQADGSSTYSTTNLQEAGVDESDVIKSDGAYFYIARGNTVRIIDATPLGDLREVSRITFDGPVVEMYLYNSKLLALGPVPGDPNAIPGGAEPGWPWADMSWPPYMMSARIWVASADIADPAAPQREGQIELDGALIQSRLTGDRLYLVLTITPDLPANPTAVEIAALTLDDVLPRASVGGDSEPMVGWQTCYRPGSPNGYFMTGVVTLDAADVEQIIGSVALMANAGTIYASPQALYVTDTDYDENADFRQVTVIHKFEFDQTEGARYVGSGRVPGRLLNQFSLGENGGFLRVATHVNNIELLRSWTVSIADGDVAVSSQSAPDPNQLPQNDPPYNAVYVLHEAGDALEIAGTLENIAPGESIYAARFLGDRGFLVTFRQIDPLTVLDLSDPNNPRAVGELHIPGYSDYLHPYGENLLIGVGRSTHDTSWGGVVPKALQLSLFDVSDLANPTLVQQLEVGGFNSYSDVSYTHKAFTFLPSSGRLAIPAELYPTGYDPYVSSVYTGPDFNGVILFQVSTTGFQELGRVPAVLTTGLYGFEYTPWRRAAIIGDDVYALTEGGIRAANLSNFGTTTTLTLGD